MLQVSFLRENTDLVVKRLAKRNMDARPLVEKAIQLDEQRRKLQTELDNVLAESNKLSKEIGILFKSGKADEANKIKEQTSELKDSGKDLSEKLNNTIESLNELLHNIPNVPNELVPEGRNEEDNLEVFKAGEIPELGEGALPHWELAKKYDIIDFELGNKITGSGFPVYKGKGAKLQRALISYFLDKNTAAGYDEVLVPLLVNSDSGFGTGQLPDKEGQMYHVTADDLYLIPTAEVPATNIFRGDLLKKDELPKAITGYTPCFRREAGSYGAHV
ncbi:MAG: serine--tRNA ligase, partial [Bacteroidia bacterium]|nr:serine--tRNA ligase [Bacteroidia bacterium]